jgi:hypothetical protein
VSTREDAPSTDPPAPARGGGAASTHNPASAVYGTVLAGSLMAVQGGSGGVDVPRLVVEVLVTQVVYWLAHSYAELVGGRITSGHRPHRSEVLHLLHEEWPLVTASFEPLVVTVLAWALGVPASTAVLVGIGAGAVMLAAWALLAGTRARLRPAELALYVLLSTAFGAAVVLLKVLVH